MESEEEDEEEVEKERERGGEMFRLHRHKQEKSRERIDFKFSNFHALQVFTKNVNRANSEKKNSWNSLSLLSFSSLNVMVWMACRFGNEKFSACFRNTICLDVDWFC